MLKKSVESEELGVEEKLSLLMEGLKGETDFVALQISVKDVQIPLLATQNGFSNHLIRAGEDPAKTLRIHPEKALAYWRGIAFDSFDVQTSDGGVARLRFDHVRRQWQIDAVYD